MTAQPHETHRTPAEIRAALKADRKNMRIVRDALPEEDREAFDRAYWHALDKAKVNYNLTPITEFQTRWWWEAYQKADPEEYADTIARAEAAMNYYKRHEGEADVTPWSEVLKARNRGENTE